MSDFYSSAATTYVNASNPGPAGNLAYRRDGALASSGLKWFVDTYTTTTGTDESDADYLLFGRVSKGQKLFPLLGFVFLESGLSTALAGTLGVRYDDASLTDDYDALSSGLTLSSEGRVWLTPAAAAFEGYEVLGDGYIAFDPTTVTTIVESKKLALAIPFLVAG